MDFISRFQGRTAFITKKGEFSNGDASPKLTKPIRKSVEPPSGSMVGASHEFTVSNRGVSMPARQVITYD